MRESINEELAEEEETEINLTPMLDVVFIMLIFFIVTAVFVKEPGVDVDRPEATTAFTPEGGSIFVAIDNVDQIFIDGDQVELSDVRLVLERLRSENPESGLIIQSDRRAHNVQLIAVMDAAKQAGLTNMIIAAGRK